MHVAERQLPPMNGTPILSEEIFTDRCQVAIPCKIDFRYTIDRYEERLSTSHNQFRFQRKCSTVMCAMLAKKLFHILMQRPGTCVFVDASRAFDKVHCAKLFTRLFDR